MAAKSSKKPAPKIKLEVIRDLARPLEVYDDAAEQIAMMMHHLEQLEPSRHAAAAAAALAHTRKGKPAARGYLQAIVDLAAEQLPSAGALLIARQGATVTHGRRTFAVALVELARGIADTAALEAAYVNLSQSVLDQPELIELGVQSASDAATRAERSELLALATRLAPLLEALSGSAPERKRAAPVLAALTAAERRHVHRRMLGGLEAYDNAQVAAAVLAMTDDPSIPAAVLAAALPDARYHGVDDVIAVWQQRTAAGDAPLIARLVELFETTAATTKDDDHLEPFIHALYPASSRPEVFAAVERALDSDRELVRAAVCEEWLREADGHRAFTDAQIDRLIRRAIAIAAAGPNNTDDRRAAGRALFYISHDGARHALLELVRTPPKTRNDELIWDAYYGLSHIKHPDVWPALLDQLFVETKQLDTLKNALGDLYTSDLHVQAMGRLDARRDDAAHAARHYADVVSSKPARDLLALGRLVAAWPARGKAAADVRYVLELATAAALRGRSIAAARLFVDRLAELGTGKPAAPLAEPEVKKLLAALKSGALERELAAARTAGKPVRADDARLAALTGGPVDHRLVTVPGTHEVWFFDDAGALLVYDGYEVAPAPCTAEDIKFDEHQLPRLLGAGARLSERATKIGKRGRVLELQRFGSRVLIFAFIDGTWGTARGLAFTDEAAARRLFGLLRDHDELTLVDPWYVDGQGALRRRYAVLRGREWPEASAVVNDGSIEYHGDEAFPAPPRTRFDSAAEAIAAYDAWEAALYVEHGARLKHVQIDDAVTRRSDTLIATYLEARYRDDDRDAVWHLRALADMWQVIVDAGLADQVPEITVTLGPPASAADIAAYQALVPEPLPASLVELWTQVGGGGFTTAAHRYRLLSPRELVAERETLRAQHRAWIDTHIKRRARAEQLALADRVDTLAAIDDQPLIVFDVAQTSADGRCFASAGASWWESSLGWQIATDLAGALKDELVQRLGDVSRLTLDQRPGPATKRTRLARGDKFWEAIVDGDQLFTRSGRADGAGVPSRKRLPTPAAAAAAYSAALKAARVKGFR